MKSGKSGVNMRRAILHIGTEKTGTTSIQHVLSLSRDALIERGFAYSRAAGNRNHLRLAAYAGDPPRVDELRNDLRNVPDAGGPYEAFPDDLAAEMAALPAQVHTVIFSGEHCHSRLVTVENVERLKGLMDRHFSEYVILVYLRRQDELAISHFSTQLRNGQRNARLLPVREERMPYFDYAALLDRWKAVFGRAAMRPRLYGRAHFAGGDLLEDLRLACGIGAIEWPEAGAVRNPSLIAAAQEFLHRFNATESGGPGRPRPRWPYEFFTEHFAGPGKKPLREEARSFVERFLEGNERVRAEYFPDRPTLFSDDFGMYPETEQKVPEAQVLEVAMKVVEHLSGQPDVPVRLRPPRPGPGPGGGGRGGGGAGRGGGPGRGGGGQGRRPNRPAGAPP